MESTYEYTVKIINDMIFYIRKSGTYEKTHMPDKMSYNTFERKSLSLGFLGLPKNSSGVPDLVGSLMSLPSLSSLVSAFLRKLHLPPTFFLETAMLY